MSERTAYLPSASVIRPIATPETGAEIGTPASIRARVLPQVLPIELEPFDSRVSETIRMVYGKSGLDGRTATSARSTRAPWPMSRRLGPRIGRVSPTENGGKL